jgi:hypothetical protein
MNRLLARLLAVALPLTAGLTVAGAAPGSAHELRTAGPLRFVVGWGDEPAYTGFKNSVQVTITEANDGAPVTDVVDSLKVEVIKGSDTMSAPLVANFRVGGFGTPGDYRAWLTPTRPGAYTFRITGTIRGQTVNESFSSSSTTFNDVEDVSTIQFPAKDPTAGQLATRIDREVPRLESALREAEDQASGARLVALVGLAVGLAGLFAGAGALIAARRRGGARGSGGSGAAIQQSESLSR